MTPETNWETDFGFFSYCERRHRDNVVRFLRAIQLFKSAMLQPLGGRTASSIMAQEMVDQYVEAHGPLAVTLSPGTREAVLARWAAIVGAKDFSRLQRTFFDTCRSEVERGELAELVADYKAFVARLEREEEMKKQAKEKEEWGEKEKDDSSVATVSFATATPTAVSPSSSSLSSQSSAANKSGKLSSVLSSLRKSTESLSGMSLLPRGHSSSSSSPKASLPLSVAVRPADSGPGFDLSVDLVAADTHLSWTVRRTEAEFRELHESLKRYRVSVPQLPKGDKKLEAWLQETLQVAELSASRDMYVFLSIGRTVDLLAKAARNKRSTIAVQNKSRETMSTANSNNTNSNNDAATGTPSVVVGGGGEQDALAMLSQDDLAQAMGNLELLEEGGKGTIRARKAADGDELARERVSAEDIAAALKHLLGLQFTDSPMKSAEEEQLGREMGDESEEREREQDREEEDTAEAGEGESNPSTVDTFGNYPLDTSAGKLVPSKIDPVETTAVPVMGGGAHTAEFDLRAVIADQARTIDTLRSKIAELEAKAKK